MRAGRKLKTFVHELILAGLLRPGKNSQKHERYEENSSDGGCGPVSDLFVLFVSFVDKFFIKLNSARGVILFQPTWDAQLAPCSTILRGCNTRVSRAA